jgi:hypothetical protein
MQDTRYKELCDRSLPQDNYWAQPVTKQTIKWRDYTSHTVTHADGRTGTFNVPKNGPMLEQDLVIQSGLLQSYKNDVWVDSSPIDYASLFRLAENVVHRTEEPEVVAKILNSVKVLGPSASLAPAAKLYSIVRHRGKRTARVRSPRKRPFQRLKCGSVRYTTRTFHYLKPDLTRMQYPLHIMLN